ncbi:MAG: inositol monophosphatase family protein [Bacteroidota bacterium]
MDLDSILKKTTELSLDVAEFIKSERSKFNPKNAEYKGKNDLVSYVDREAEKEIVKRLRGIYPEAGFVTEEGTAYDTEKEAIWIIDPLDGTTNFIHGVPTYSISIGLMDKGKMVLGVVHEVNRDECFYSASGQPAFCNGEEIHVSEEQNLSAGLMATGFPYYDFEKMEQYLEILKGFMRECHGLRRIGSAAVDLAYVACGRFEGFFEYNLNAWDVAAGSFLVQQAGGIVTDFSGGDNFIFGKEIVSGSQLQPEILKVINKYW